MRSTLLILSVVLPGSSARLQADDWPQWMGPQRDSVWREDGIVDRFPKNGLKVTWRAKVQFGYAGPAVADGRVYVTDYAMGSGRVSNNSGTRDRLTGKERVLCFDVASGKQLWNYEYDRAYAISYPSGPRCTPTIDSGKVYTLGAEGDLLCLDAKSGQLVWSKLLTKGYNTQTPVWGFAAHPLVDGDLLYCVVGGKGSVAVAFNKNTGHEVWRALTAREPGYCPPTMIEHAGIRQLLIWHPESLNSLDPKTGKLYWSLPLKPSFGMSIAAPRQQGRYLFACGIGNAAVLLELDNMKPAVKEVWRGKAKTAVYSANSTPFVDKTSIYGVDTRTGALIGAKLETGERYWETFQATAGGTRRTGHATAFLVKHDRRFFLFNEAGDLVLANLSPQSYKELDRFHVLDPTNTTSGRNVVWSHPAFAARSLFARNDRELVRVSLARE